MLFIFRRLPPTRALVDLMRSGAFDVLDTEIEAIGAPLIQQILNDLQRRLDEIRVGGFERDQAHDALAGMGLIGESVEMQNLFVQVLHAARSTAAVMISGEPGSGKRLVAHAIHALGPRSGAQIVTVDCLSLSPALLNASLFGVNSNHGAAVAGRGPLFAAAEHGTLLLNEVSEMPSSIQESLQKALDPGDGDAPDVRLISTASKRIDQLVEAGLFRADLCFRLNAMPIDIPPLRRRLLDVPLLSRYFLSRFEREGRGLTLSEEAAAAINRYHWPGNVRELKGALDFAAALAVDGHDPAFAFAGSRRQRRAGRGRGAALHLERVESGAPRAAGHSARVADVRIRQNQGRPPAGNRRDPFYRKLKR